MTEYWERTVVTGRDDEKMQHREEVLHRRGQDPVVMACRRNQKLAGCNTIYHFTAEAFLLNRDEGNESKRRKDIPRDERREDAWEW